MRRDERFPQEAVGLEQRATNSTRKLKSIKTQTDIIVLKCALKINWTIFHI